MTQGLMTPNAGQGTLRAARTINGFVLPKSMIDVRGWKLATERGMEVGSVDAMMVETPGTDVRWLAVTLNGALKAKLPEDERRTVLVPVGRVRILGGKRTLVLDGLSDQQLLAAPAIDVTNPVKRETEDMTLAAFGMPTSEHLPPDKLYAGPGFDLTAALVAKA